MNYYPHHIGDYSKDTAHLSILEDGAYRRLLDLVYGSEKPLPKEKDRVYRLARARTKEEKEAIDTVLAEFFTEVEGGWMQLRALAEILKAQEKSGKAAASAAKRWQCEGNAKAMRTHSEGNASDGSEGNAPNNQEPITNNQKEKSIVGQVPDVAPRSELKSKAKELLWFLNSKAGRNFEPVAVNLERIEARLKEGASFDDCKSIIAKKCGEWSADEKMAQYLRPATLFNREKFWSYHGQLEAM